MELLGKRGLGRSGHRKMISLELKEGSLRVEKMMCQVSKRE
jgi:hypothetical protein